MEAQLEDLAWLDDTGMAAQKRPSHLHSVDYDEYATETALTQGGFLIEDLEPGADAEVEHDLDEDLLDRAAEAGTRYEMPREVKTSIQLFFDEVAKVPLLTATQEVELAKAIERGDQRAKTRMIEANLRMVIKLATGYQGYQGCDIPLLDLIEEGTIGLNRAAEKFDWRRGYKFSTYAYPWIRQALQRAIQHNGRDVRIPVNIHEKITSMKNSEAFLVQELGRQPTTEEIADFADLTPKEIRHLRTLNMPETSLNRPIGDEQDAELIDLTPDLHSDTGEIVVQRLDFEDKQKLVDLIMGGVGRLSKDHLLAVTHRFGLGLEEPKTLEQTAILLGMTREAVRKLEHDAMPRPKNERRSQAVGPKIGGFSLNHAQVIMPAVQAPAEPSLESYEWGPEPTYIMPQSEEALGDAF